MSVQMTAWNSYEVSSDTTELQSFCLKLKAVCCGVRGRAFASHTDVRVFEPQCGGRLSYFPADNSKEVLICHEKGWWFRVHNNQ